MHFLTQGDPEKEDVVMSLWHDKLKMLLVTDGEKGCRYFTKVLSTHVLKIKFVWLNRYVIMILHMDNSSIFCSFATKSFLFTMVKKKYLFLREILFHQSNHKYLIY